MYAYIKTKPKKERLPKKISGFLASAFVLTGVFLLGQVVWPIAGWYLFLMPNYTRVIASPLASTFVRAAEVVAGPSSSDSFKPGTWFAESQSFDATNTVLKTYTISVPKLEIDAATVEVGGDDLKKSLVAWPTSALPGAYGNNIVFGHSELPQFASPNNYSGIFTHLMDLTSGDEILVDYDGVRYKYQVVDKKIVSPTDLSVLEQRFDAAYITLITCEPPGTTWTRGVVRAQLVQI